MMDDGVIDASMGQVMRCRRQAYFWNSTSYYEGIPTQFPEATWLSTDPLGRIA